MSETHWTALREAPCPGCPVIRAGDTVRHGPSGETWLVAAVHGVELAPAGWPEGIARIEDCTLVERCGDLEHVDMVERARRLPSPDCRRFMSAEHLESCLVCQVAAVERRIEALREEGKEDPSLVVVRAQLRDRIERERRARCG